MYLSYPKKIIVGISLTVIFVLCVVLYRYFIGFPFPYWKLFKEPFFYPFVIDEQKPQFIRFVFPNKIKFHETRKQIQLHRHVQPNKLFSKNNFHILYDVKGTVISQNPQNLQNYHWIVTTQKSISYPNMVYVPHWSLRLAEMPQINPTQLLNMKYSSFVDREFCVALKMKKNNSHQTFVNLLQYYRTVDLQDSFQNIQFEKYRFVVIFEENEIADGHICESFYFALIAGCIPIYFGAPDVADHFNPARFISIRNFPTYQQCVSHILQIEDHRSRWEEILRQPNIFPNKLHRLVGWYFKHREVFETSLYSCIPEFHCPDYAPLTFPKLKTSKPIKIINLNRSTDRWKNIQAQFQSKGFQNDYERFPAIEGKQFKDQLLASGSISSKKRLIQSSTGKKELTNGEIGCYLSHMELYYTLSQDLSNDFYCILEDDVQIREMDNPNQYAKEAPVDWDIIYLGVNQLICGIPKTHSPEEIKYIPFESSCIPCTFAYLIRKRTAQFLLNFGLPMEMPIDHFIRSCSSNIRIYIRVPNVVWTDVHQESTIGTR